LQKRSERRARFALECLHTDAGNLAPHRRSPARQKLGSIDASPHTDARVIEVLDRLNNHGYSKSLIPRCAADTKPIAHSLTSAMDQGKNAAPSRSVKFEENPI
jgi:hypothetical protein